VASNGTNDGEGRVVQWVKADRGIANSSSLKLGNAYIHLLWDQERLIEAR